MSDTEDPHSLAFYTEGGFVAFFFFFSSRRRHTRCREVSWARRCVQETVSTQSTWDLAKANTYSFDTEFEELFDLKDASPLCSKHGSVSFTFNKVYKAHFLAASGEDMVLLTYTFASKGLSLIHI
eukprot:TRINITY_DN6785_c0_g1_i5.p1 TRINITY_DN6785_c0_g1~~TRINITY_DN6785_c0_g1_i5.p1  ORF type:complete len:125 (-),score=51.90 TRINITY_DN6785_c0_g1_i5:137-511(-)